MKALFLFLILASTSAFAAGGTLTPYTTSYNGYTRSYSVYVPPMVAPNAALWVMLHPTAADRTESQPPTEFRLEQMEALADANKFIVLWPVSTYVPSNSSFFWEADFLCTIWTSQGLPCPDDSGFIRSLIVQQKSLYPQITKVYVVGMSSGAFMANRVGADSADLVTAVGAASGQIYAVRAGTIPMMPQPSRPVKVLLLNGDADPKVIYCGQNQHDGWGQSNFPSSQVSLDYWAHANGCTQSLPQLCTNGDATVGINGATCGNVTFTREQCVGHTWVAGTESVMWRFFTANEIPVVNKCPPSP